MTDHEPDQQPDRNLDRQPGGGRRWVKPSLIVVAIVVAVYVLFTWVFPWITEMGLSPAIE